MKTSACIVCVGEGEGERLALPELVRRWLQYRGLAKRFHVDAEQTIVAGSADRLKHAHIPARRLGIEHYVGLAQVHEPAAVIVVLDADDSCEARTSAGQAGLGPYLLARASAVSRVPVGVVVADREFEAWLLADFAGLRQRGSLKPGARLPDSLWRDSTARRDCKSVLNDLLPNGYRPSADQAVLVKALSRGRGIRRKSRSYRKFETELERLVSQVLHWS